MNESSRPFFRALVSFGILISLSICLPAQAQDRGSGKLVFNILDFGAKRDASTPATEAFRRAIEAAKVAGGGTIYVPPGNYVSGPIELFSNMTLNIEGGATITFPVAPLPFVKGRYLGVEALVPMPLIGGRDLENVTIKGRGIITTGDFPAWGKAYGIPAPDKSGSEFGPHWDHVLQKVEAKQQVSEEEYRAAAPELRPSVVSFMNAKNGLIEGIRIVGGPAFVVHLLYSENVTVRNIMIEAYPGQSANGIVVDSSRFVRISDDYIDTGDDGIVVKSGKDADGLRVNRPSQDVAITNCTVHHAHGAVVIGSETSGSIRNIVASNITAVDTENGIRIKSRRGRGGVVEGVRFDNWTMENVGTAIVVTSYYEKRAEGPTAEEPVSERTPVFRNIAISGVVVNGANVLIDVEGLPERPISNLHISDVIGTGKAGLVANYSDGLELHDVQLNSDNGPAFQVEKSTNLELDHVSSSKPHADAPIIRLVNTPGAMVRGSKAFPGTGVFLSTARGELKGLLLEGNELGGAQTPQEEK